MLTTFQLITLDYWEDVYNKVGRASKRFAESLFITLAWYRRQGVARIFSRNEIFLLDALSLSFSLSSANRSARFYKEKTRPTVHFRRVHFPRVRHPGDYSDGCDFSGRRDTAVNRYRALRNRTKSRFREEELSDTSRRHVCTCRNDTCVSAATNASVETTCKLSGVVGVRTHQRLVLHGGRILRIILPVKLNAGRRGVEL